jgi:chromosome segregation ATPase
VVKKYFIKKTILATLGLVLLTACVPSNEYQSAVNQVSEHENKISELKKQNENMNLEIENLKDQLGSAEMTMTEKNKELNEIEEKLTSLKQINEKLEADNKKLQYYERLRDFSEIEEDYNLWVSAENYKQNFIKIYDEKSERIETNEQSPVGVNFKIRNLGDKDIISLSVKVYYLDNEGRAIYESSYNALGDEMQSTEALGNVLKAGYIWESKKNYVVIEKFVPSEWQNGNIKIEIDGIKFEKK